MTDNSFPITPPPKLVEKWIKSARYREFMPYPEGYEQYEQRLTTLAARWGADMELRRVSSGLVMLLLCITTMVIFIQVHI